MAQNKSRAGARTRRPLAFANLPVAAAREASKSAVVPRPRFKELRRRLDEVPFRRDAREAHKRLPLPSEDLVQQMSELCAERTVLEGCSGSFVGSVWSVQCKTSAHCRCHASEAKRAERTWAKQLQQGKQMGGGQGANAQGHVGQG